ncbi:hypothetical protein ES705_16509 [subsurface metagenome]
MILRRRKYFEITRRFDLLEEQIKYVQYQVRELTEKFDKKVFNVEGDIESLKRRVSDLN